MSSRLLVLLLVLLSSSWLLWYVGWSLLRRGIYVFDTFGIIIFLSPSLLAGCARLLGGVYGAFQGRVWDGMGGVGTGNMGKGWVMIGI